MDGGSPGAAAAAAAPAGQIGVGRGVRGRLSAALQAGPYLAVLLLVLSVPLVLLVSYSFRESSFLGVGPGPTLEQYRYVFDSPDTIRLIFRTLGVALGVAGIVTTLAFVIAYAITFRLRGRVALVVLGVVVATGIASFLVRVFAWGSILGTKGLVNEGLSAIGVISDPLNFIFFGYFAIAVTMTYLYLPLGVLIVYSSMQEIDRETVEASRDLGAGRWRTIFRVVAPQARVGLVGALALITIVAASDFVTPRLVGGARGVMVGAVVQDLAVTAGNLPGAAALALSFLAIVLASIGLLLIGWRLLRPALRRAGRQFDATAGRLARHWPGWTSRISLSVPATFLLLAYLVVPAALAVLFSFNAAPSTGLPITGLTTDWYPDMIARPGFSDALRGSLTIVLIATPLALLIGIPAAFALARAKGRWSRFLWAAVLLPFLIPGVLFGSALLVTALETGFPLGVWTTAVVHVVLLVSEMVIIIHARLAGMDEHLVEAARDLGASAWRALRTVTLPLLLPAIVGAALLGAAYSLDELFVTTFTIGTDNTLPVWLFGLSRRGFTPGLNAIGVMLMAGTLIAFALAVVGARRTVLRTGSA